MAKSKKNKKDDDDEDIVEDVEEEAVADEEVAEEDAEEEAAEEEAEEDIADEPVDTDEPADEEEAVDAEAGDDEPDDDEDDAPLPPPKPKITKWAIALILLNWIAAPAFLYVAYVDHLARAHLSVRTLVNYVQVWGLPLEVEEETYPSLSTATRPIQRFTHEQLNDAFKARQTGKSIGSDKFQYVEEAVPLHLRPADMTDIVLSAVFMNLPDEKVPTLDAEIRRLQERVPKDIANVTTEVRTTLKTDDEKRVFIQKALYTMVADPWRVAKLDQKVKAATAGDLDKLVDEASQRRLYYDILAPINVFRPGDMADPEKRFQIERLADLDKTPLAELPKLLDRRLNAAIAAKYDLEAHRGEEFWKKGEPAPNALERDTIEKRRHIAFILFTLGQVQKPTLGKKLYDKGVERAQVVCGLHAFTSASMDFVRTQHALQDRIVDQVVTRRQGWLVALNAADPKNPNITRTPGFIDEYELQIDRLVKVVEQIDTAQKRIDELKRQRDDLQKIYLQRERQHKDAMDRLLKARAVTEKHVAELRDLQNQLHEALRQLSDAAERNFEIEAQIRAIELDYLRKMRKSEVKK